MNKILFAWMLLLIGIHPVLAQDDLSALIESMEEPVVNYATAGFKTTRVINGGAYELFGLDQASIRIGLDYGITKQLMVGFGRSSFEKTYDIFAKYKLL